MGCRLGRFVVLAVVMAGMAAGAACGHGQGNPGPATMGFSSRQTRVPGEYLVTLVPGAHSKAIADLYGRFGIKSIKDLGNHLFLVSFTEDPGPARMEELRGQNTLVKAVQPNFVYRTNEQ